MFAALGKVVVRARWWVIAAWIVAVAAWWPGHTDRAPDAAELPGSERVLRS